MKIALLPSLWEGLGEGRSYGKEKNKLLVYAGFSPRGIFQEGLSEMMKKYPNWFSPHLHEFWGQAEKLPFDQHWLIALAAPRPSSRWKGPAIRM